MTAPTGIRQALRPTAALLFALAGSGCANSLFYHPDRRFAPSPDTRGLRMEEVDFQAADGVGLTGWWLPTEVEEPKGTVVHFHGNAQNMSTHVTFAEWLPAKGFHLFVFDYRGFGRSEGVPTRRGLVHDGLAALETVAERPETEDLPLWVWGQSLGGTVALQSILRSEAPVQGMVVDSTFVSHGIIAAEKMRHLPWFLQPLRLFRPLFVSNGLDARDALKKLPEDFPLLFIHGEDDRVIPPSHSRRLYALRPENSKLIIFPDAGHCNAVLRHEVARQALLDFFEVNSTRPAPPAAAPDPAP